MAAFEVGDRVKIVAIILPPVAEKNRPFYEQFRGLEGTVVDTGRHRYPKDSYTDIRVQEFTTVSIFPYKVNVDGHGIQPFCEKELEKI